MDDGQPMRVAIDLDGVLTEHPRPLAQAASARFGVEMPESAFIDSAGLNVPIEVRDWVYGPDGPASKLCPDPEGAAFMRGLIERLGVDNVKIVTARPRHCADMTVGWLRRHDFPECDILYADLKTAIALRHNLGCAVEDSLRHARNYAAAGVSCFLVKSNEEIASADEIGIIRVNDLPGVLALVDRRDGARRRRSALSPTDARSAEGPRPRIVVSDAIHPAARAHLATEGDILDVDGTNRAALLAAVAEADALVVRSETMVDAEVLAAAPHLRVIARAGVGVDNIDLDTATRAGVVVLNAPGANAVSAAEHTIALLLGVTRQIPLADASTRAGRWARKKMRPVDLKGRTVGIVGLGRVGSRVAARLRAFEMKVIAYDPYIATQRFTEIGAAPVDYQTLLANSDVVTFHVPSTPETTHMLNAETMALLKPGAIVINAARGEVVDQAALAEALRDGRIAGAGVDVFPHEPCTESPLFDLPNVVLTPHIGGSSAEALAAVGEVIGTSTLGALRGEVAPNAVNLPPASLQTRQLQRLTGAAAAAGRLLSVLAPEPLSAFTVTVDGLVPADVAEHVLASALSEALGHWTNRRATPVNARLVAQAAGVEAVIRQDDPDPDRLPSFEIAVAPAPDAPPAHTVVVRWDRTEAAIMEVDGFGLKSPLAGDVLITHHRDQPGMIGHIGTILGRFDVNIAGMQVGRMLPHRGGEAMMVLNVDDEIPETALAEIVAMPGVHSAYVVSLPPAGSEVEAAAVAMALRS
ncbi:MAG: phosphoglycerate dehydrogenase [Thermomicrobiales bacterium]|nr:phosphoglycerate dehydrogenase [Thermomicrobiales bacterium]